MTPARTGLVLPFRRRDARPDAELLTRFLEDRDEAAFEALLARHAPGVRAACRGWLRAAADVDDAAQATFLVLALRAGAIRDRAAVGRWLYGVAGNVARRLRRRLDRSRPLPDEVPATAPAPDDGLRDLLAEEVARLPEKYRLPVQLCYAAGLTTAEAAGGAAGLAEGHGPDRPGRGPAAASEGPGRARRRAGGPVRPGRGVGAGRPRAVGGRDGPGGGAPPGGRRAGRSRGAGEDG